VLKLRWMACWFELWVLRLGCGVVGGVSCKVDNEMESLGVINLNVSSTY
jgi:hypothetical protein